MTTNYYYKKLLAYRSLRKSLQNGSAEKRELYVKHFQCACHKHKLLLIQALAEEKKETIRVDQCEWSCVLTAKKAISSSGEIRIEGYEFYSKHPEWKVRAAVSIGLRKINTKKALNILSALLKDEHYGVRLVTVQSLEIVKSESALALLEAALVHENADKRLCKAIKQSLKRMKFGVVKMGVSSLAVTACALDKLQDTHQVRKIYHHHSRQNKILIPRSLFYNSFGENELNRYFNHWSNSLPQCKNFTKFIQLNEQRVPFHENRTSTKKVIRKKKDYIKSLFFRNFLLVDALQIIHRPVVGEIYWALTDKVDPKITRPVLVMGAVQGKPDYFIVAPCTTQVSKVTVTIDMQDKKSYIQLWRKKVMHQSLLINQCGCLDKAEMDQVVSHKNYQKRLPEIDKSYPYRSKRSRDYPEKHRSEIINLDIEKRKADTDINSVAKRRAKLTLFDFLEQKDKDWLSTTVLVPSSIAENTNQTMTQKQPERLTPRRRQLIEGTNYKTTPGVFERYVKNLGKPCDINARNIGKKGNTALGILIGRSCRFRESINLPKIEILIRHGALWNIPNRRGKTPEDLLKTKSADIRLSINKLRCVS